ncbi:MAG: FecR family protein [Deltaproteobacteria bacterium]|nr:FecR family protein [Deltaproteobacteria bacterium]
MKQTGWTVGRWCAAWVLAAGLLAAPAWAEGAARVTFITQPAEMMPKGSTRWRRLNLNDEVREGDRIRTGMGGRVEILLSKNRVLRVGQASEMDLPRLFFSRQENHVDVRLVFGQMWTTLAQPLKKGQESYRVRTPTATLGVKGTRFNVDADKDSSEVVLSVVEGEVVTTPPPPPPPEAGPRREISGPQEIAPPQEVTREEWSVIVGKNKKAVFRPGAGKPQVTALTEDDLDQDWEAFNLQRDAELGKLGK